MTDLLRCRTRKLRRIWRWYSVTTRPPFPQSFAKNRPASATTRKCAGDDVTLERCCLLVGDWPTRVRDIAEVEHLLSQQPRSGGDYPLSHAVMKRIFGAASSFRARLIPRNTGTPKYSKPTVSSGWMHWDFHRPVRSLNRDSLQVRPTEPKE